MCLLVHYVTRSVIQISGNGGATVHRLSSAWPIMEYFLRYRGLKKSISVFRLTLFSDRLDTK